MLNDLKILLGIEKDDAEAGELLQTVINLTTQRLTNKLGVDVVPAELEYIVTEIATKRFNRIGSEGLAAHSVEGESLTFAESDFDEFQDDVQAWLARQDEMQRGKVRFL